MMSVKAAWASVYLVLISIANISAYYDVNQEIEELKLIYGNNVLDKPCQNSQVCEAAKLRTKRFLFGSSTYCHDKLGCFPTNGVFSERVVNLKPNSREIVNTQFTLFTRSNPTSGQRLVADDPSTISRSLFGKSKKTQFIIHGYLEDAGTKWYKLMNAELLKNGDYNVINVDWGNLLGSKTLYSQATANTRVVAAEIAYLLKTLMSTASISLDDVHLIGHSLGAHIAGYAGQNMSAAIGRVTGLDPAEPYFEGYSRSIRLDPSDAKFVEIIHSDADSIAEALTGEGGFGTNELSGHADFFPNGGLDQPNCRNDIFTNVKLENDLYHGLKRLVSCDHDRAIKYFTESINDCRFTAIQCTSYKKYEDGKCPNSCTATDRCNSMGFHAHKPLTSGYKKYYLHTTGEDGNFCATGFQVKVKIEGSSSEFDGSLDITVSNSQGKTQSFKLNKEKGVMTPGKTYTYQIGISTMINPNKLVVKWTRDQAWWKSFSKACGYIGFCSNSIKIEEIELTSQTGRSYYFCGSSQSYRSGVSKTLSSNSKSCAKR